MEDYNSLISARILDGYDEMIDRVPQATMFGGKRMRSFVLPGTTESDYPGTLSVGRMDGQHPQTLGSAFWKDFGDGFPEGSLQGGKKLTMKSLGKDIKKGAFAVNKALKSSPIARSIVYNVAPELTGMAAKEGITYLTGNPALGNVAEIGVKKGTQAGLKSEGYGGKRKNKMLHSVGKVLKDVGKVVGPAAKEVFQDVIVPEGKKALRDYIRQSLSANSSGQVQGGRKSVGGALIRDVPSQFHSSVYPPALASYTASVPKGKDAYGRGRSVSPKQKRPSARGAIVSKIMKEKGMSLPQASKYVKEKGLY